MPARAKHGAIVVLNAGSSSVKFAAFACEPDAAEVAERLLHGEIDGTGASAKLVAWKDDGTPLSGEDLMAAEAKAGHDAHALGLLFGWLKRQLPDHRVRGVAHRVVHGGERFTRPVRVTPEVLAQLEALVPLAPLHQPHNLAAIRAIAQMAPALPQIACFDTAFHAGQDWVAQAYALPRHIRDAGVRRYGFHGLSYEYIAGALPARLGPQAEGRIVVAHLGNGASLCALRARRSVATTMGFTALDGLVMGTRCGSLDPGVVLYLAREMHLSPAGIEKLLYQESGLLGVSEISSDMRTLEDSADPRAAAAIDLFVHRIGRELGSLAAALGGIDALVFTAGIGEHSRTVRQRVCEGAAWLGLELDEAANQAHAARISTPGSRVSAWVIPTNEELMLARHAQALLAAKNNR
ncbi:acetate kinase [Rhodoferax koreense]|uniref:Acetate kinase n=2 Tax=Rhodoferax koreensis TaxID=1842727 RepID=A0A1P8K114_9BURK|nr:acetate kinase [Rhodoferax koreense]